MSSIAGRVMRGTLWVSLGRIAVNLLTMLSMFVLAWLLTPSDFGLVAIAGTIIFVISAATELSLSAALVRHASPDESHLSAAWTLNAVRSLGLCLITCAISWPVAQLYEDQRLIPMLCVSGAGLFIGGLINPRMAIAQRDLQFRPDFIVQTGQKLAGLIASFSWAFVFRDYWALVVGSLAIQISGVLLSYIVLPFRPRILFKHFREFFGFSGWLLASQIVNSLNWRFDQLLAGKMFGAYVLGYYNMGSNIAQLATREAIIPLTQPLFPAFVAVRHDKARLAAAYQRVQAIVTAVALPVGVSTALIAEPLIRLVLGEKWLDSVPVVQALATIGAVQTMGSIAQPLAMALDQTQTLFRRDLALLALRIVAFIGGALAFGIVGLIAARVGTQLVTIMVNTVLVRKLAGLSLRRQLLINGRTMLATGMMVVAVLAINPLLVSMNGYWEQALVLGVRVIIGALAYIAALALLWVMRGRPAGPEAEGLALFGNLRLRLRTRSNKWRETNG